MTARKVCHVLDSVSIGGLEKTAIAIASDLTGYEHHLWCLTEKGPLADSVEERGVAVRAFGFTGGMSVAAVARLAAAMRRERFAIVHGHGLYPSIWARTAALLAGVRTRIVHVQTLYVGLTTLLKMKLRVLSAVTSRVIAVSEAVKETLVREIGIAPGAIDVVYNSACDMRLADGRAREEVRRQLGAGDAFVVGSVGRLEEIKGHGFLIDAMKQCADRKVDARCLFIGDGPERPRLAARAAELGIADRVHFLGMRDDIAPFLAASDALAQPSILREGLPLALAEGASAGLPLIATSVGGNVEIVIDGRNGFLVPPADPSAIAGRIALLAGDRENARRMGMNARGLWQERFSRERMLRDIRNLYDRCVAG